MAAWAKAKLDCRLVADQSPDEVLGALRAHRDERGFSDSTITTFGAEHPARTPINVQVRSASGPLSDPAHQVPSK